MKTDACSPHRYPRRLKIYLWLTLLLLLTGSAAVAAQAKISAVDSTIFGDALTSPWQDYSYSSTINFDSNTSYLGAKGIAVTHTGDFGAFSVFNPTALSATEYRSISFWAYGAVGGSSITLSLGDEPTEFYEITIPNAWTYYNVLLAELGNPATFNRINWQSTTDAAQATYYLDEITVKATTSTSGFPDSTADESRSLKPGPSGVAVAPNGRVYVAVYKDDRVYSWATVAAMLNDEAPDKTFGSDNGDPDSAQGCTDGPSAVEMCGPESVAVDSNGNLFIADTYNHRVLVFRNPDTDGTPLEADAVLGQPDLTSGNFDYDSVPDDGILEGFCFVRGLAVDAGDNLWAVDEFNYRVIRFDTPLVSGSLPSKVFGQADLDDGVAGCNAGPSGNSGAHQFSLPLGVAVDGEGTLYVTDLGNNRVQRFAAAAANGANAEESYTGLNQPHDVAVDASGNLYIADTLNSRLLLFAGGPSGDLASDQTFPGRTFPMGMAFTANGDLLVADCGTPIAPSTYPPCLDGASGVYFFAAPEAPQNEPPDAIDDAAEALLNTPLSGNVLTNDSDPQDSPLTVTDFTQPGAGLVTVSANGLFTFTPQAGFLGETSFNYTVSNAFSLTDTATVTVDVVEEQTPKEPPVAANDTVQTLVNTAVNVNVLSNDDDPQDSPLTVTAFTQPDAGTVAVDGNGVFTFTPPDDFLGQTSFDYTVSNSFALTDTATVTINVVERLTPENALFMPVLASD